MGDYRLWASTRTKCEYCKMDVRNDGLAKHAKTAGHIARLKASPVEKMGYKVMASDIAFSSFLANVNPRNFWGYEGILYDQCMLRA